MLNPARASSEPTEVWNMMELFELCRKSKDEKLLLELCRNSKDEKQLFSECIGKDPKGLVEAEQYRMQMTLQYHKKYKDTIKSLEKRLLVSVSEIDKIIYKEMRLIYGTIPKYHYPKNEDVE